MALALNISKILAIAVGKSQHNVGKEWCAYLTPSEILALRKTGIDFDGLFDQTYQAKDRKLKGIGNPRWVYFIPNEIFFDIKDALKY